MKWSCGAMALVLVLALGCTTSSGAGAGSGTGTGTGTSVNAYPSGAPVAIEQLDATIADVFCKMALACKSSLGASKSFATVEGCKAFFDADNKSTSGLTALVKAGKVKYDATQAGKCLQAVGNLGCSMFTGETSGPPSPACKATFTGTVAEGGACTEKEECVSQVCEQTSPNAECPGKCGKARLAAGAACTTTAECETGLACTDKKCATKTTPKVGEECSGQCEKGAYCEFGPAPSKPVCKALSAAGAKCQWSAQCLADLYCKEGEGGADRTCAPRMKAGETCEVPKLGGDEPCAQPTECAAGADGKATCQARVKFGAACTANSVCDGVDLACIDGTCKLLPKKGEACAPAKPDKFTSMRCMPKSVCIADKCDDPPGADKPCAENQCAKGLTCKANVCKPLPGKGEECQGECQKGFDCMIDGKGKGTCAAQVCGNP